MRGMWVIFLVFICGNVNAATLLSVGARLCEAGKYWVNGACRNLTDAAALSKCPSGSHLIWADSNTFVFKDISSSSCSTSYNTYLYNKDKFSVFGGTGSLLSVGARLCEAGKYWVNGACRYPTDKVSVSECPSGSHLIWADSDTFAFKNLRTSECYATHSGYSYNKDSFYAFGGHGLLQTFGTSLRSLEKMRTTKCTGASDSYYRVLADTNETIVYPKDSECPGETSEFVVMNNCQNIDTESVEADVELSVLHPGNNLCAVLCESGYGLDVFGKCSPYCLVNKEYKKMHIVNDGRHIRIPLWKEALTTPALHVKLPSNNICHISLDSGAGTVNTLKVRYNNKTYHSIN